MLPSQLKNALVENWKFASQTSNSSLKFIILVIEELLQEVMCFEDCVIIIFLYFILPWIFIFKLLGKTLRLNGSNGKM